MKVRRVCGPHRRVEPFREFQARPFTFPLPLVDTTPYFRLPPYEHQRKVWEESRDLPGYALWWEMGVGKTCATIGTTSWLYRKGKINTLVVVAPNGVHANWTLDEVPTHLPDDIMGETLMMTWYTAKKNNKSTKELFDQLVKHEGLAVFVMSYDAVMTQEGSKALKKLLEKRECIYVLDESGRIKTPGAKRTKRILASSSYAKYKRVLTGTPVDNSPFDVYTQVKFIRPEELTRYGVPNFGLFKVRYGIWEQKNIPGQRGQWEQLVRYINLDELHKIVDSVGSRLLKTEVLDLPDSIYERRYFDLDPPQRKAYRDMEKKFRTWLGDNGTATADIVLTRMLRMTQLSSGFVTNDDGEVVAIGENTRLKALKDVLEDVSGSVIIFCRWTWEFDQIRAWLGEEQAVYVDGRTPDEDRIAARHKFQKEGSARFFVAKQSAVSEGYTLHRAKTVIYMTNSWSLRERLQSEARAHRAGMSSDPVTYIDLIARGTYDEKLIGALHSKRKNANTITGDSWTPWI